MTHAIRGVAEHAPFNLSPPMAPGLRALQFADLLKTHGEGPLPHPAMPDPTPDPTGEPAGEHGFRADDAANERKDDPSAQPSAAKGLSVDGGADPALVPPMDVAALASEELKTLTDRPASGRSPAAEAGEPSDAGASDRDVEARSRPRGAPEPSRVAESREPAAAPERGAPQPRPADVGPSEPVRGGEAAADADPTHSSAPAPARTSEAPTAAPTASAASAAGTTTVAGPQTAATAGPATAAGKSPVTGVGSIQGAESRHAFQKLVVSSPKLSRQAETTAMVGQATRALVSALKQGDGTLVLRLEPKHLGQLKLQVKVEESLVTARIETSSAAARELLSDSMPSLRAALEARGLSVDRIDVAEAAPPGRQEGGRASETQEYTRGESGDGPGARAEDNPGDHGPSDRHAEAGHGRGTIGGRMDASAAGSAEGSWVEVGGPGEAMVSYGFDSSCTLRLRLDAVG